MNTENQNVITEDFILLTQLVEQMDESAAGRASIPLEEEEIDLLNRMANGNCSEKEKTDVIEKLVSNREAMEYFAAALKGEPYAQVV